MRLTVTGRGRSGWRRPLGLAGAAGGWTSEQPETTSNLDIYTPMGYIGARRTGSRCCLNGSMTMISHLAKTIAIAVLYLAVQLAALYLVASKLVAG